MPFWTKFNVDGSFAAARAYVDEVERFRRIGVLLFPHGTRSIGLAPMEHWRALMGKGDEPGALLGVEEAAYPADFASFGRYQGALDAFAPVGAPPEALTEEELRQFLAAHGYRYPVSWITSGERVHAGGAVPGNAAGGR